MTSPIFFPAVLRPIDGSAELGFDLVISEAHEGVSVVTKHPVEKGPSISDNMRSEPSRVTLVVFMRAGGSPPNRSEMVATKLEGLPKPSGLFAAPLPEKAVLLGSTDPDFDALQQAHDYLDLFLRAQAILCDLVTSTRTYTDGVVTKVSLPRTELGGGEITIEFEQIRFASSLAVTAPTPKVPSGAAPVNKGAQTPAPTPEAQQPPQSFAAGLLG